ncbi:hypothetical protein HS088_TW22G00852 [Tripterygium wilfordii]|uniref:Uncharacterized protein n=1 Tax=Tripterygium wilfordii TaxID=458696 RepID=A0A7J7BZ70_TRIWF|nr:uncharacterized protein LOC119991264 isoform X2 [Tripterygium wilfordii]KAF5727164.1 hypothetical protein HS088_TW22G00852 [Tripterygium wilfordii]
MLCSYLGFIFRLLEGRNFGMGTKVHCKSSLSGYYSMRDLNEDSDGCSWPMYYGDKTLTNGHYYNGFLPGAILDGYAGYDKDVVKRTMLEHEAIFKNQVFELHRLYRIQRDMMEEIKRTDMHSNGIHVETSLSSSPLASRMTSENSRKWHILNFPLAKSACARTSTSGAEDIHSPFSALKGNSAQASQFSSPNGCSSKEADVLYSRPSKMRRKLIDLQLPSAEYIDTDEGELSRKEKKSSFPIPNGIHKFSPESVVEDICGDGIKSNFQGNAVRLDFDSRLRSAKCLADLNEPVQHEELHTAAYVDHLGCSSYHVDMQHPELPAKVMSQCLGLPKEISVDSRQGKDSGIPSNLSLENNGKSWSCHFLTDDRNDYLKPDSQGCQPEELPIYSKPPMLTRTPETPAFFITEQSKADQWKERSVLGLEIPERNNEVSKAKFPESATAPHIPSLYPAAASHDLVNFWCSSASSWQKPGISLSPNSISVQTHPYLNTTATLNKNPGSTQGHANFGDKWQHNGNNSNAQSNMNFVSEFSNQNGFYRESSSQSKELPVRCTSIFYDNQNCGTDNTVASEQLINHGSAKFYGSPNCMDVRPSERVNLNVALSNNTAYEPVHRQGLETSDGERKQEEHLAVLPWLKANSGGKNEPTISVKDLNTGNSSFSQSSLSQLSAKSAMGECHIGLSPQTMKPLSPSNVVEAGKIGTVECQNYRTILGFPIFESPQISKTEASSFTSPSVPHPQQSVRGVRNCRKNITFDINLPCDYTLPELSQHMVEETTIKDKGAENKIASFRLHIDLNSCMSEDDDSLMPSVLSSNVKVTVGIDLEAPAIPETEEDLIPGIESPEKANEAPLRLPQEKAGSLQDDLIRTAAEAIVSISSLDHQNYICNATCDPSESSMVDPLQWFSEIVSSCGDDPEGKFDAVLRGNNAETNSDSSLEQIDYFESMTLKLTETKEEDYMPKPLVSENLKLEETGATSLANRPRKGQGRRGRQRRDFQRDVLVGIASLSRHEVTEDLQTFGGLMRATGHSWQSGSTRRISTRNGCARGRWQSAVSPSPGLITPPCTQLIQQLNNTDVGLEDRSLTGWGKTTRRPRRQRCPAGNPHTLPLT